MIMLRLNFKCTSIGTFFLSFPKATI